VTRRGPFAALATLALVAGLVFGPAIVRAQSRPWRELPLASASLEQKPQGEVALLGGFAAVRNYGTHAVVCVSFKNVAPQRARRVVFEFPFVDAGGTTVGTLTLDRKGEFSSNADIMTYASFGAWESATSSSGRRDRELNCIARPLGSAGSAFLRAHTVSYHVVRVEYDGGKVWTP